MTADLSISLNGKDHKYFAQNAEAVDLRYGLGTVLSFVTRLMGQRTASQIHLGQLLSYFLHEFGINRVIEFNLSFAEAPWHLLTRICPPFTRRILLSLDPFSKSQNGLFDNSAKTVKISNKGIKSSTYSTDITLEFHTFSKSQQSTSSSTATTYCEISLSRELTAQLVWGGGRS